MPEAKTSRPHATGYVSGNMSMRPYGLDHYSITIDPKASERSEFRVKIDENFGPQITDHREHNLHFSRRAATELRDALTAALEWEDESDA